MSVSDIYFLIDNVGMWVAILEMLLVFLTK